ncbi:helix-turn-helix transcriptional regulator [Pigmentiphaga litoralis]|uniref:helix-turn-helix transcriptional regulator n=1 Tax=Pigmentiphaga litoralis TaxID=516702 RepID=UPI003B43A5AF
MSRAERLLSLMQHLRSHKHPVTGTTLAARMGVSLRTLYRDIASLQAQGADITGEPGVGYVLKPGYLLPPLMFSVTELEALVLGMRWVNRSTDDELGAAAKQAMAKISSVLPVEMRRELDANTLLVGPRDDPPALTEHLPQLRDAIRRERKLDIDYTDANGAPSSRTIWPFALGFFERQRVVVAWCEKRQGFRHFRADRLTNVTTQTVRYPQRRLGLLKRWRAEVGITGEQ